MKLLPHQEQMIKNMEKGFPEGKLVFFGSGRTYTPNETMSVELIRREIESGQPINLDSENPYDLKETIEAIDSVRAAIAEMPDEDLEKAIQSGELIKFDLENPEGLQNMLSSIREQAKQGSVKDQAFLDRIGPRGKIDKEDVDIFATPISAPIVPETPEGVDEGTVLHKYEVRYYEQGARQIPANRLRMFIWAKDYDHALEQFQNAEPTSISVVVIDMEEKYVPGSV